MAKSEFGVRRIGGRTAQDYTIIIAYDGELTEEEYFRGWKLVTPPSRLTIEPLYVRSGGNALKAVEKAIKSKKKYRDFAEFWCVCDVDDTSEGDLAAAKKLAFENDIRLCLSNRCFEVWIALHYCFTTQAITCERDAIDLVRRHYQNYGVNGKTIPFHKLQALTQDAIDNATRLSEENFDNLAFLLEFFQVFHTLTYLKNFLLH